MQVPVHSSRELCLSITLLLYWESRRKKTITWGCHKSPSLVVIGTRSVDWWVTVLFDERLVCTLFTTTEPLTAYTLRQDLYDQCVPQNSRRKNESGKSVLLQMLSGISVNGSKRMKMPLGGAGRDRDRRPARYAVASACAAMCVHGSGHSIRLTYFSPGRGGGRHTRIAPTALA